MWLSGKSISGRRNSKCKGPEVGMCLECRRKSEDPSWLERSEQGRKVVGEVG